MDSERLNVLDIDRILEMHRVPAIILDKAYRIHAVNSHYRAVYGDRVALGRSRCYEISHDYTRPCDQEGEHCPVTDCINSGQSQRLLHVHLSSEGREHVDVEVFPIFDDDGEVAYMLEILTPIQISSAMPSPVGLVGVSSSFMETMNLINRVAGKGAAVLLTGESGTGKEVAARAIHDGSQRYNKPFVPVECSGLTETLFESELFGYERGAFTGALARKSGLVEVAHGGTLFLDEIGDVPLTLQVKLLRLLETKTFRRVGGVTSHHSDFRLICATNRTLEEMIEQGTFRTDLYYRIGAFPIQMPPLRERQDDLELLISSMLTRCDSNDTITVSPAAMQLLKQYDYPGNIRELLNILERAVIMMDQTTILPEHLPTVVTGAHQHDASKRIEFTLDEILTLEEVEQAYLQHVLRHHTLDRESLATQLGVSIRTLYRKLPKPS
ncbi:MAG: sigma 54-interacting transcriptional regulator, partial [Magnetococcales bacterium]|nr:sigma 54-interacting transcriptional regulator [Magnetococcales bacterium]